MPTDEISSFCYNVIVTLFVLCKKNGGQNELLATIFYWTKSDLLCFTLATVGGRWSKRQEPMRRTNLTLLHQTKIFRQLSQISHCTRDDSDKFHTLPDKDPQTIVTIITSSDSSNKSRTSPGKYPKKNFLPWLHLLKRLTIASL